MIKKQLIIVLLLFAGCISQQKELNIKEASFYAFYLEPAWDLGGSVSVSGVESQKSDEGFKCEIEYKLILTDSDSKKNIIIKQESITEIADEATGEILIDISVELGESFRNGNYLLVIELEDKLSGKSANKEIELELKKE
ncbi:MAG: hypothetical protein K9I69_04400 [Ignavibacteriales bacterium]|nr:hypothetical protein [Ignavibacteriales bacterium]MCF8305656.1 hypothetical protein [Ignavibacteriales bacterium]MCF8315378.1 hypothetical protein [Ignavibacteriales bacterium]MCF8436730.1 hypothetical protein [Ignavibacteriales bacterium]